MFLGQRTFILYHLFGGFVALQNLKYFLMKSLHSKICIQFCFSTKTIGFPSPLLKDKVVRTFVTSGTCISCINFVCKLCKVAFDYGSLHFVFGWNYRLWFRTRQFWSVPFVSREKRIGYLETVKRIYKKTFN